MDTTYREGFFCFIGVMIVALFHSMTIPMIIGLSATIWIARMILSDLYYRFW